VPILIVTGPVDVLAAAGQVVELATGDRSHAPVHDVGGPHISIAPTVLHGAGGASPGLLLAGRF
jgi:hypothetical protein